MKQDYICTYAYDGYVINILIKAYCQFDASIEFRKYISENYVESDNMEIRVRPLDLIQVIEVTNENNQRKSQ